MRTLRRRPFSFEGLETRLALSGFYVSPTGSDSANGTVDKPWKTVQHAVDSVASGDVINLRAGTYPGVVTVRKADLTIQSYPGERAALTAPTTDPTLDNVLWFTATGGKALNLDISGGYDFGVKFDVGGGTVDGCKVSGTGYYGIKIVPGADNVTISRTEVANTGVRTGASGIGGGIDDVNGDYLTIQDCYVHDNAGEGIEVKGGAIGAVIQRNRVENCKNAGILVGQSTGESYFDKTQDPNYYEIIAPIVRNNIVRNTDYAGIAIYAAQKPQIYNNTLVDTARVGQASFYLSPMTHNLGILDPSHLTVTTDPSIVNNIDTRTTSASTRPLFHILNNGFTGTLTLDHNRYYVGGGTASFWDERSAIAYYGTWATWPSHIGAEAGSSLGDPGLTADGHLVSGSACIDAGRTLSQVTDDIDGDPRTGVYDIGADEYTGAVLVANQPPVAIQSPVANPDTATTLLNKAVKVNVLANDTDPNGDVLTVQSVTRPSHGSVVVNTDGTLTYTPVSGFLGTDTFSYTISDGHGGSSTASVTITVKRK